MKLHAARLFVYNLAAAQNFYVEVLGLSLVAGSAATGYCVFDAGHTQLVVEAVQPDAPEEDHALVGRFSGLSFSVTNVRARYAELQARGVYFAGALNGKHGMECWLRLQIQRTTSFNWCRLAVRPNPSLKLSRNGGPPGPVWRYAVRGTFSPARAWRPAVGARLAGTLGGTKTIGDLYDYL